MTEATFERQAELLETIHRCARELRELAGDALVITIEPAREKHKRPRIQNPGIGRGGPQRAEGDRKRAAIMDLFKARPGDWIALRDVIAETSLTRASATGLVRQLLRSGQLEHNGGQRNASRYRLASDAAADPDPLPGGASSRLSPRTRKSIERAERETAAAAASNGQPDGGDVEERVLESIRFEAGTITEVAMRTDIPRRHVGPAIETLKERGLIVHCGERFPQRHKVYGAVGD